MASPTPFSRLQSTDPDTNRIVQDIYDKINQISLSIHQLQSSIDSLSLRVKKLGG